jgi:hypothetical protein
MSKLAKILFKENNSGFKSFIGSSAQKDTWLFREEILIKIKVWSKDI